MKYNITPRYLSKPSKRRCGLPLSPGVKFIVAHDTDNSDSTADKNVSYYENTHNQESTSSHIFVDDKEIIECIPALTASPEKAWHVVYNTPVDNEIFGVNANDAAIGIEYCFGPNINADAAYDKYVWVIAYACYKHNLDPRFSVVGHFFLDPWNRQDPITGLARSRRTYEQLLHDVVNEFTTCFPDRTLPTLPPDREGLSGTVQTHSRLNIRKGAPSTRAPIYQVVNSGTQLIFVSVKHGDRVNNNDVWYGNSDGNYFWSGGVE